MKKEIQENAFNFITHLINCYHNKALRVLPSQEAVLVFHKRLRSDALERLKSVGENSTGRRLVIQELVASAVRHSDAVYELLLAQQGSYVLLPIHQEQCVLNLVLNVLNDFIDLLKHHLGLPLKAKQQGSVPYRHYIYQRHEAERLALQRSLEETDVADEMKSIINHYLISIVDTQETAQFSLEALAYYSFFLQNIYKVAFNPAMEANANDQLWSALVKMNFNPDDFIHYSQEHYLKSREGTGSAKVKAENVLQLLAEVQAMPKFLGPRLRRDFPEARLIFKRILKETYKRLSVSARGTGKAGSLMGIEEKEGVILKVNFTLRQLLFLFKVMAECNLVETLKGKSVFSFIHRFIRTKRQDQLSIGSMQRKHGHIGEADKKRVKVMLHIMINHINSKYISS